MTSQRQQHLSVTSMHKQFILLTVQQFIILWS